MKLSEALNSGGGAAEQDQPVLPQAARAVAAALQIRRGTQPTGPAPGKTGKESQKRGRWIEFLIVSEKKLAKNLLSDHQLA